MLEWWETCQSLKKKWIHTFFDVGGWRWYYHEGGGRTFMLWQRFSYPSCLIIMDTMKHNHHGRNVTISIKTARWTKPSGWIMTGEWHWGWWQQIWCCNDAMVAGIFMMQNCAKSYSIMTQCIIIFPFINSSVVFVTGLQVVLFYEVKCAADSRTAIVFYQGNDYNHSL